MTKTQVVEAKMVREAKINGYEVMIKGRTREVVRTNCPACTERAKHFMGENAVNEVFVDTDKAMIFTKGNERVLACTCGYRRRHEYKYTKVQSKMQNTPTHTACTPSHTAQRAAQHASKRSTVQNTPATPAPTPAPTPVPVAKCKGKGCSNDLPAGRKSYCYSCRKPVNKKETQTNAVY